MGWLKSIVRWFKGPTNEDIRKEVYELKDGAGKVVSRKETGPSRPSIRAREVHAPAPAKKKDDDLLDPMNPLNPLSPTNPANPASPLSDFFDSSPGDSGGSFDGGGGGDFGGGGSSGDW